MYSPSLSPAIIDDLCIRKDKRFRTGTKVINYCVRHSKTLWRMGGRTWGVPGMMVIFLPVVTILPLCFELSITQDGTMTSCHHRCKKLYEYLYCTRESRFC